MRTRRLWCATVVVLLYVSLAFGQTTSFGFWYYIARRGVESGLDASTVSSPAYVYPQSADRSGLHLGCAAMEPALYAIFLTGIDVGTHSLVDVELIVDQNEPLIQTWRLAAYPNVLIVPTRTLQEFVDLLGAGRDLRIHFEVEDESYSYVVLLDGFAELFRKLDCEVGSG